MFSNRNQAGIRLATAVQSLQLVDPVVIAIPRGGVETAYPVAVALRAPLYIIIARKIGAPFNPEFAIGAVAPDGSFVLNEAILGQMNLHKADLEEIVLREREEIARRSQIYGRFAKLPPLGGRDVVLIDDGIATGHTIKAAIKELRKQSPRSLTLAVPVMPYETVSGLQSLADHFVCLEAPEYFMAIGQFYEDFPQLSHETVLEYLQQAEKASQSAISLGN